MEKTDEKIPKNDCNCAWDDTCHARGRGLQSAVRGRRGHFDIYFRERQKVSILIEIKGPENTICSEEIKPSSGIRTGISFRTPFQLAGPRADQKSVETFIPLWYQVFTFKIAVYYIPLVVNCHKIRIFNQGLPLRGSPFLVQVHDLEKSRTFVDQPRPVLSAPRVIDLIEKTDDKQLNSLHPYHLYNDPIDYKIDSLFDFLNKNITSGPRTGESLAGVGQRADDDRDNQSESTGSGSPDSISNARDDYQVYSKQIEESSCFQDAGGKDHGRAESNTGLSVRELIKFWDRVNLGNKT